MFLNLFSVIGLVEILLFDYAAMEVKILTHLYRQNMATSFRILGHHRVARARTSMQQQHWRSVRLKMKKSRQIGDRRTSPY